MHPKILDAMKFLRKDAPSILPEELKDAWCEIMAVIDVSGLYHYKKEHLKYLLPDEYDFMYKQVEEYVPDCEYRALSITREQDLAITNSNYCMEERINSFEDFKRNIVQYNLFNGILSITKGNGVCFGKIDKFFIKYTICFNDEQQQSIIQEAYKHHLFYKRIGSCPQLYAVCIDGLAVVMIMENVDSISLYDYISKDYDVEELKVILFQILVQLHQCHLNEIVHYDLHPHNIMLEKRENVCRIVFDNGYIKKKSKYNVLFIDFERTRIKINGSILYKKVENISTINREFNNLNDVCNVAYYLSEYGFKNFEKYLNRSGIVLDIDKDTYTGVLIKNQGSISISRIILELYVLDKIYTES